MQREVDVERKVVKWAEKHGILQTKLNLQNRRGWPDRVFWIPGGRPVLIEFKRLGEAPTKLQWHIIEKLKAEGYDVNWTQFDEEAIFWLKEAIAEVSNGRKARNHYGAKAAQVPTPRRKVSYRKLRSGYFCRPRDRKDGNSSKSVSRPARRKRR